MPLTAGVAGDCEDPSVSAGTLLERQCTLLMVSHHMALLFKSIYHYTSPAE